MVIEIKKTDGKWLVNGKLYADLIGAEKQFFDEFITEMKYNYEENKNKLKSLELSFEVGI